MIHHHIGDWDLAYTNDANIAGGDRWPALWETPARLYRARMLALGRVVADEAYGPHGRQTLDLFLPEGTPKGLVVFVHGGYWLAMDGKAWSHLANGAVARGYAVAIPTYRLCPQVRIGDIVADVSAAIALAAGRIAGPLHLTGHSAGGHLVARMVSEGSPLAPAVRGRIRHTLPISGLHDLRPIMRTAMNATLNIDADEAAAHSPALLSPLDGVRLTCWVGGAERSEFRRQSALLANVWTGLGAATAVHEEPDRHHFNIVDGLGDPDHPLTETLLS